MMHSIALFKEKGVVVQGSDLIYLLLLYCVVVYSIMALSFESHMGLSYYDFLPGTHTLMMLVCGCQAWHVTIEYSRNDLFRLKRKARDIFSAFLQVCTVKFIGVDDGFFHHNISGVKYPVDFFIQRFYDRHYPEIGKLAADTYRRVNPTLDLRLDHLDKYGECNPMLATEEEIIEAADSIVKEMKGLDGYGGFIDEVKENFKTKAFDQLRVDGSSAAGYPFKQGEKRRDVMVEAVHEAEELCRYDGVFLTYMSGHKWYSTGRARMIEQGKPDKGRLILYGGFASMLIAMLFLQPLAKFMNNCCDWCAVGMSWMYGGAREFAEFFQARDGYAPTGYRYVSVDIKEWDTKLHPQLMKTLVHIHGAFLEDVGDSGMTWRYLTILKDMICAFVLMPMGYLFQVFQGMKSGWANTANDNTLIHEVIFRVIMKRIGYILHLLYGDDNYMLVPNSITDAMIVEEYARLGCIVGRIHSSAYMGDVDFLAKFVTFSDGEYLVHRPAVETHARLIMPEELNPGHRDRPDPIVAAERALGHLLDNPFNKEVRMVCTDLLGRLNSHYGIGRIEVTEEMKRSYPWRGFGDLPIYMPVLPSDEFINELYGVFPRRLIVPWPSAPQVRSFDWSRTAVDADSFYSGVLYSMTVTRRFKGVSHKKIRSFIRDLSPFVVPRHVYGTHAGRLECIIRMLGLTATYALDLGAHPGACACSLLKIVEGLTVVSLQPDDGEDFCHYIPRDEAVELIRDDADFYEPYMQYDIVHDDVDVHGSRNLGTDATLAKEAIQRARKYHRHSRTYIMTIRDVTPSIIESLYELYVLYGDFTIVKPHYSNPWRLEFVVVVRRSIRNRRRKHQFLQSLNFFLNKEGHSLIEWSAKVSDKLHEMFEKGFVTPCPYREDAALQKAISDEFTIPLTSRKKKVE